MEQPDTRRIRFTVQYDGSAFYGWQLQRRERSVQGELEAVLSRLFARPARVHGSGRTDRGVHAVGQVGIVDAPPRWSPSELRRAMNALLPPDVWIREADDVPPRFHPRYDAVGRSYVYRVGLSELTRSPFHSRWCWAYARPVDRGAMERATEALVGDHSFLAFAKAGQEHLGDRCIVTAASWREWQGLGLEFTISANRFLHHMVRYLVGTLVEIGAGRRSPDDVALLLRRAPGLETSPPAPPQGLFLERVEFPALPNDQPDRDRGTDAASLPSPP